MDSVLQVLRGGAVAVLRYFAAHVLVCLLPAFFIAGAVHTFFSRHRVLALFSRRKGKIRSFLLASVAGSALSTSAKGVLPYFASVCRGKSGPGPAYTLLYSGPAVNVVAAALTFRVLGWQFGVARIAAAVAFSLIVGPVMGALWGHRPVNVGRYGVFEAADDYTDSLSPGRTAVFFALLVSVLAFALAQPGIRSLSGIPGLWGEVIAWIPAVLSLVGVVVVVDTWFTGKDLRRWLKETWQTALAVMIRLAVGVFIIGVFQALVPNRWVNVAVGGNRWLSNLISAVFGSVMYFATATEVPLTRTLLDMGAGFGPGLALLLTGPVLSLTGRVVMARAMGWARTAVYGILVLALSIIAGWVFGLFFI